MNHREGGTLAILDEPEWNQACRSICKACKAPCYLVSVLHPPQLLASLCPSCTSDGNSLKTPDSDALCAFACVVPSA